MLKLALKNLRRRKSRTILTIFGIFIAISFTVGLLSISEGFLASIDRAMGARGEDILVLPEEVGGHPMPMVESYGARFSEKDIEKIGQVENVKAVYPIYTQTFYFAKTQGSSILEGFAGLNGITPDFLSDLRPFLEAKEGRLLKEGDEYKAVLGNQVAKDRGLEVGDAFKIRGQDLEVVGVLKEAGTLEDMLVYAPIKTIQKLYDEEGKLTIAAVTVKDLSRAEEAAKAINETVPNVTARTIEEMSQMMKDLLSTARAMHLTVASITLLIGILFILSTMLMAVSERIKEIGTMRAIGTHRSQIFKLILFESLMISIAAGILGLFGGYILSKGMTYVLSQVFEITFFTPLVSLRILALGFIVSLLIGGIAGLLPALKISKINIAKALRYE